MTNNAGYLIAYVPIVDLQRLGGTVGVFDGSGAKIGQVDVIRGFAHYYGVRGSAHEGVTAVVRGGVDGLVKALASPAGLRSGRDDRL